MDTDEHGFNPAAKEHREKRWGEAADEPKPFYHKERKARKDS
jgi:hypothetical protein